LNSLDWRIIYDTFSQVLTNNSLHIFEKKNHPPAVLVYNFAKYCRCEHFTIYSSRIFGKLEAKWKHV